MRTKTNFEEFIGVFPDREKRVRAYGIDMVHRVRWAKRGERRIILRGRDGACTPLLPCMMMCLAVPLWLSLFGSRDSIPEASRPQTHGHSITSVAPQSMCNEVKWTMCSNMPAPRGGIGCQRAQPAPACADIKQCSLCGLMPAQ